MGYDRSRLSHHLARMESRGLITRQPAGGGVVIAVTDEGRDLVKVARRVHAAAVRRHLINPVGALNRDALLTTLQALAAPQSSDNLPKQ
jgi:DNA-binding MarR family transcriptional regulator